MRLPKSFYERPLTPKEAQFATDNINIVWWYLDQQGLDRADWFDVVIFRYLISVKRWFALPDLQKVKFVTVACNAIMAPRKKLKPNFPRFLPISASGMRRTPRSMTLTGWATAFTLSA